MRGEYEIELPRKSTGDTEVDGHLVSTRLDTELVPTGRIPLRLITRLEPAPHGRTIKITSFHLASIEHALDGLSVLKPNIARALQEAAARHPKMAVPAANPFRGFRLVRLVVRYKFLVTPAKRAGLGTFLSGNSLKEAMANFDLPSTTTCWKAVFRCDWDSREDREVVVRDGKIAKINCVQKE